MKRMITYQQLCNYQLLSNDTPQWK